ncbi:BCCT family transporter [Nesterenkonia sphaerica]|uniref:BCCT family transporter n=1 Tax=Nesterenkonia sphaerica TaxID=1804988 RepID=A0A5R9A889_9MICC|nr:BCCT family transporter [Nesterenkonia sphaerica]TLP74215.1 BCCT family transporter [Nesterenkonia sphaerica]
MTETSEPPSRRTVGGEARRAGRRAGEAFETLDYRRPKYPHNMHPALVPGIGIDEQRRRYGIDKVVFFVAGTLTVAFVLWGVTRPAQVSAAADAAFTWVTYNISWLFIITAAVILIAMLTLAVSRYGRIPLGTDGETPEFSTFAWISMLFAAGLGIGVLFFGPSEPLTHFTAPPPLTHEAESTEALHYSLGQTYFHWGFHAWAIYALVGGAVAYAAYRRGRVLLMSSIFRSLFGKRHSEGLAGQLIDVFAIIATLFGTAATVGIAAMQVGQGVTIVAGWDDLGNTALVIIMALLTVGFIISAVSGVARGIRYLSNVNIVMTLGIVGIIFLAGPTLFLANLVPSGLLEYAGNMFDMMSRSASWGEETQQFQSWWTVYYWAWWISWSPFVGIFIARISRGRTIRQFVLGVTIVPTALLVLSFGVMGGTAMWMYREGYPGFSADMAPPEVFFAIVENIPLLATWVPFVAIAVLAVFAITALDSASTVMGILSSRGSQSPKAGVVVFWGLVMTGIAVVMLLLGDAVALEGLQQLVIITAVPFAIIMLLIIVAWFKELRTDPLTLRHKYADTAVSNAVLRGVEQYGDNFALGVVDAGPGDGAGADVDSAHSDYTDWYQRTNADGEPVGYDFETGQWADNYDPETGEISTVDAASADEKPSG